MTPVRPIALALLAGAALLALPGEGHAQRFRAYARPLYRVYRPAVYAPNRMPGWDWWRTYPWSRYNYGRNPYNPAIVPYPYVYPYSYPVYPPYPVPPTGLGDGAIVPTAALHQVVIPHPVSSYTDPPANAAVIEVRVPDLLAQVSFDGVPTSSVGDTRYYVTPELQPGKTYQYTVGVAWPGLEGQTETRERTVKVVAAHTSVVDFNQPAR
jgi:uncharacterized protein (TIGR03000 family)